MCNIIRHCTAQLKNKKENKMSFTQIKTTQKEFLEDYLRGTGRTLSGAQARATFGIMNLRARVSELRKAGLRVRRERNTEGRSTYAISARDVTGSRSNLF
jgi:hypothetical protein